MDPPPPPTRLNNGSQKSAKFRTNPQFYILLFALDCAKCTYTTVGNRCTFIDLYGILRALVDSN
jgi:hypothetical protein